MSASTRRLLVAAFLVSHAVFVLFWMLAGGLVYFCEFYVFSHSFAFRLPLGKEHLGNCTVSTTDRLEDLVVNKTSSEQDAQETARTHGAAILQSVLAKETAQAFRDYVMKANTVLDPVFVMAGKQRVHIMPPHTVPIVQQVFREVAEHKQVRSVLDDALGPSATLVGFSVITSKYNAVKQGWHSDTGTSSASYPDHFVPELTVAIALQDTTAEMGATGICPGTHTCQYPYLGDLGCSLQASMSQGDALLYDANLIHRGEGHNDTHAPDRAIAFLIFAGSRQGPDDNRLLPLGTVHSLNWRMWGQTLDDLATMHQRPWRMWHAFGLFNGKRMLQPMNVLDAVKLIFVNKDEKAYVISNKFDEAHFVNFVDDLLYVYGFLGTVAYASIAFPLVLWLSMSSRQSSKTTNKL